MKKIRFLLMIVSFLALVGCAKNAFRPSDLEPSTAMITEGEINGSVKESSIQSLDKNITLVFENLTDTEYYYGLAFVLEVELEGSWYQVPFDEEVAFIEIAMFLEGNAATEEVIDLSTYFKNLPAGKYRIVKDFWTDNQTVTIAPTFEIKPKNNMNSYY